MSDSFEKQVQIQKTDDERQVAVGIVMVPNEVDSQGDFERASTINTLSEDFMERLAKGTSQAGVMHVEFPGSETLTPVENRVLSEPEKIGDEEYQPGTWVAGLKVKDDTVWGLIKNETLSGFSIGGHVHETDKYSVDELPDDVEIDDGLREAARESEASIREITKATIGEYSLVDFPAVQRAQIQTAKADDLSKAANELTESVDVATEYLVEERGHDPEPARELAAFLNREKTAGNDGSWLTRAKKFFTGDEETDKAGRTLSDSNVKSAMTVHDAALDMLGRSDVAHGRQRFTDDPSRSFDIGSYGQQKHRTSDELAESSTDGTESETADSTVTNMDEEELDKRFESLNERFDTIEEKLSDEADDADESDETAKTNDGEEISIEQLAEQQEKFADGLEQVVDTLEQMASAQGVSQQADKGQGSDETEKTWEKSPFGVGGGR